MHAWVHSSADASPQVRAILTLLTCSYHEETSVRTNINDTFTHALLLGTRRKSNRLFGNHACSMIQELYSLLHIHFYTKARVLSCSRCDVYDAKPQLVKTPVEGKPSTISPNHTCQCSLLILSYNISPSNFSIAHYL